MSLTTAWRLRLVVAACFASLTACASAPPTAWGAIFQLGLRQAPPPMLCHLAAHGLLAKHTPPRCTETRRVGRRVGGSIAAAAPAVLNSHARAPDPERMAQQEGLLKGDD